MESLLDKAIKVATEAHKDQVDKAGNPYIEHPLRVMNALTTEVEKCVGVLHDVLEDSDTSFNRILEMFGGAVATPLLLLDKTGYEDYYSYIEGVKKHPVARQVKIADLIDNINLSRLPSVTQKDIKRTQKYLNALAYLLEE